MRSHEIAEHTVDRRKFLTAAGLGLSTLALASCSEKLSAAQPARISLTSTEVPLAPPAPEAPLLKPELENTWRDIAAERQGRIDIAVFDSITGQHFRYTNTAERFKTASIVKLSILERVLLLDQAQGHGITPEQMADTIPMITRSDNGAASELWNEVGAASGMQEYFNHIGIAGTTAGSGGYWGATLTSAPDQIKVVNTVAYPSLLAPESAAVAADLMHRVVPGQRWGITGGVPDDVSVGIKNGWFEGRINSIGHVSGRGVNYTIAALTDGNPSMQYGIETIEALSAATWAKLHEASLLPR